MWRKIDPEEPTPLSDQVYVGCSQSESRTKESDVNSKIHSFVQVITTYSEAMFNTKSLENRSDVS